MKALLLNGSPRIGGNTETALKAVEEGFKLNTNDEVEILNIREYEIAGCKGCDYCRTTEDGTCITKDDGIMIANKILEADAVIFASPVYWWGVSSQLKTAIDRIYMKGSFLTKKSKKIGVIAIGGATLDDPEYKIIGKQFECIAEYLNWKLVVEKYISASERKDLSKNIESINQLKELYKKFI